MYKIAEKENGLTRRVLRQNGNAERVSVSKKTPLFYLRFVSAALPVFSRARIQNRKYRQRNGAFRRETPISQEYRISRKLFFLYLQPLKAVRPVI